MLSMRSRRPNSGRRFYFCIESIIFQRIIRTITKLYISLKKRLTFHMEYSYNENDTVNVSNNY